MNPDLKSRLEKILSEPIKSTSSVSGGCIADSRKLELDSGKVYFLKQIRGSSSGAFDAEECGLKELCKSGTVNVPEVVCKGPDFLLLQWIETGYSRSSSSMEMLGRQFAELHRYRGKKFGFSEDNLLGDSPQSNKPSMEGSLSWAVFYAENRLEFQTSLAVKNGYATPEMRNLMENLIKKVPDLISGTEEEPSLLHGDLWNGNYLIDGRGIPWLIDAAVYYGHREADMAMTSLFGGFSNSFYSAYKSAYPIVPGYAEREPLYQLYHLLNHLNLFGIGYYGQVISILRRYAN